MHIRVSAPPIISPCFYGIDFADADQLVASARSREEVRELLGATSLAHLSLEGLQPAVLRPASEVCRACFTRRYPTAVPLDNRLAKDRFEAASEPEPVGLLR